MSVLSAICMLFLFLVALSFGVGSLIAARAAHEVRAGSTSSRRLLRTAGPGAIVVDLREPRAKPAPLTREAAEMTVETNLVWIRLSMLGVLHLIGAAGVLTGIAKAQVGVAGGAIEATTLAWMIVGQIRVRDIGKSVAAAVFFCLAIVVVSVNLSR